MFGTHFIFYNVMHDTELQIILETFTQQQTFKLRLYFLKTIILMKKLK